MNARRLLVLLVLVAAFLPASSARASFPGPVGRIVFTSPGGSTSDIYSVAADGTDLQRLTFTVGFEQDPALLAQDLTVLPRRIKAESTSISRHRSSLTSRK